MLSVTDLTASYGHSPVLHQVSVKVAPGEVCVILGPNGAGKTTLLRAIMKLVPRIEGRIEGPGANDLSALATWRIAKAGIAYVPEGRGILNSLTVMENLELGAALLRARDPTAAIDAAIDRVLERFPPLRERLRAGAGLLSGGEQQMLALGRALIARPKVLLLDEPSLGLAPLVRAAIGEHLREIAHAEQLAVLLAEQDVSLAQRCADRALVLRQGRVVATVAPDELGNRETLRMLYLGAAPEPAA